MDEKRQDEEATIFKLNVDCLFEIFDWLDLDDRINFAKICGSIMDVFKSKEKYDTVDLSKDQLSDRKKLRNFLDCFAPDIKTFVSYGFSAYCWEMISKSCINLTTVKLYGKLKTKDLRELSSAKSLKELSLASCDLEDDDLQEITILQNLESLDLSLNNCLSGEHLWKFHKLQRLEIRYCDNIDEDSFIAFCNSNPHLRFLDIRGCLTLARRTVRVLIENCKGLETLKFNDGFYTRTIADDMVNMLTDLVCLSELDISCTKSFKAQSLLHFLMNSPKLKRLNIRNCKQLNGSFLVKAVEVLKTQGGRSEPCEIVTTLNKDEKLLDVKSKAILTFTS